MDHSDWVHEMTILYGERHAHNFRRAADALDRLAALERELSEARKDGARLEYIIEESNKGNGWLTSDVWDKAAALCPIDPKEADYVQKWVRAAIDAAMGGE
jgi:hypothetical protein